MDKQKILVKASGFGINQNGTDPLEVALEMDGEIPNPLTLLQDLHSCGVIIFTDSEWFGDFMAALIVVEPEILPILRSEWPDGLKEMDETTILNWCKKHCWIVDPDDLVPRERLNGFCFISNQKPNNPSLWNRVIEVQQGNNTTCLIIVDGEKRATVPMADKRFYPNLGNVLNGIMSEETVRCSAPAVDHPKLTKGNSQTTLAAEVHYLKSLISNRMFNFVPPVGGAVDQVLDILLSHTESGIVVSGQEQRSLKNTIRSYVKLNEPVLVTISLAVGCRIPNPLKFHEMVQLPTYGWLYLAWFFAFINAKVKQVYEPGLRIVIFDEATLFAELMQLDPDEVARHLRATRKIIELMGAPIEIIEMTESMFNFKEARKISVGIEAEKIYAIAMSMPDMLSEEAMAPLYITREKNWGELKRLVGEKIWQEAERRVTWISQVLTWRKKAKLFLNILGVEGVDACITDKDERLVFDVTANALLNHGMPVVERVAERLVCRIVPEYRIKREYPKARPVYISVSDFGVEQTGYDRILFYYLVD